MFPEPTELLLIGCLIESVWTPRSKSNTLTPKTQLVDMLTKGNFARDEWNHLLCLFNISHFSSTNCLEVMSKRTQENAGEERVTAKSKPMMNLVSPSNASESTEKTRYESQIPLSSWNEQQPRTVRPVMGASSSDYSEWKNDDKWFFQEWKSDEVLESRTGRPVSEQPAGLFTQHTDRFVIDDDDMDSYTGAESDVSLKSRSFLHRVNDEVRKKQYHSSKDATKDNDKHSVV